MSVLDQAPEAWSVSALAGHQFCLLVSYRENGAPVTTPVWFAPLDERRIVIRSGADDLKFRRIRRNSNVVIAACDVLGKPLGSPMAGRAQVLEGEKAQFAEAALRNALGLPRQIYNLFRAPFLSMTYIEVYGRPIGGRRTGMNSPPRATGG
jgi:PPOX class probable F420-dependent enzyme